MDEVKKEKGYQGLWKRRSGWYISKSFRKKDIEAFLAGDGDIKRIVLRYNKYHKKSDDGRPNFIFAFVDAKDADNIVDKLPYLEPDETDDTHYVTVDEAVEFARDGASSIRSGYSACDVYCYSDLEGRTIKEIIEGQKGDRATIRGDGWYV